MSDVTRLETLVDLRDDDSDAGRMSLSARLEAVLVDGSRVILLNGRGWVEKLTGGKSGDTPIIWKLTSIREIEQTARSVIGPDEPFGGQSRCDVELAYWVSLTEVLRRQGILADARELAQLPHTVVLDEHLLARL